MDDLPEWIPCTDCELLRDLPTMSQRRKWLRKAKAEITRRKIQERVDEIASAREEEIASAWREQKIKSMWVEEEEEIAFAQEVDSEIRAEHFDVIMSAFVKDLALYKNLTPSGRQRWIDRAALAACGQANENLLHLGD